MARSIDPGWWKSAVFYQVYPRSFQDSNGDGVGDIPGLISRLDHLNGTDDSLGIDAIWISPFYRSPMADFGYDVEDYRDVDPIFGTLDDFDELLREAHARGIRVVIDFVPNHTSDRHAWFRESRASRDSLKRDWYIWRDPKPDGSPPNNWRSVFPVGPAWTLDPATGQYYLHSFLPQQPDLNWWNPEVRDAMEDVLRFWLDRGVDGFRVDVPNAILKDPDLADNEGGETPLSSGSDWPGIHEIFQRWRRLLDAYGDRMMVGEVAILDLGRVIRYYGEADDEFHLAFNFSFLFQPWDAEGFRRAADLFDSMLPRSSWPDYTLSNHDQPRARSRYDEGAGTGVARARLAAMMLLTLRGTPFIYYGEEIGQSNGEVPPESVVDVHGRDPERTPMQWAPGTGAGFTTGTPWLPIGREASEVNVERQRADPRSMLALYRSLLRYRGSSPVLQRGSYRSLPSPEGIFAYQRELDGERLIVALNFTGRPNRLALAEGVEKAVLELSTAAERSTAVRVPLSLVELGPDEGVILRP